MAVSHPGTRLIALVRHVSTQDRPEPRGLERASNLSWLIWGGGLVGIVVIGAIFLHLAGWLGLLGFVVVLLGLLTTF
jgi:hypothetical protein